MRAKWTLLPLSLLTTTTLLAGQDQSQQQRESTYNPEFWNQNERASSRQIPPSSETLTPGAEKFPPGVERFEPGRTQYAPGRDRFPPSSETQFAPPSTPNETAQPSDADVFPQGENYYSYPEEAQDESDVLKTPPPPTPPTIQTIIDEPSGTGEVPQPQGAGNGSGAGEAKSQQAVSLATVTTPPLKGTSSALARELYPLNTDTPIMEILYNQLSPQGKEMWAQLPPEYREMATELAQQDTASESFRNINDPDQYVEKALETYQETLIQPED